MVDIAEIIARISKLRHFPQVALGLLPILAARNRWPVSQCEDLVASQENVIK